MTNLDGFIVTAPHKAEAASLCDRLEGEGLHTRVVNTIRREQDGSFTGTLLDGRGFVSGLIKQGHQVKGRRFYMAGAGGAGTALAFALADTGIAALTIHNRTKAQGREAGCRRSPRPIPPSTFGSAPPMHAATTSPSTRPRSGSSPTTGILSISPASTPPRWSPKS